MLDDFLGPSVQSIKEKAAELVDLQAQGNALVKSDHHVDVPKSWFIDPYALSDSMGLGYRPHPQAFSYDTLKNMSEREPIVASAIKTRISQVVSFCRPQPNKYSIGYIVRSRNRRKKLSEDDKKEIDRLEKLVMNCGRHYNRSRDSFSDFMAKYVRDALTWDQACIETVRNSFGGVVSFFAIPSDTIRISKPRHKKGTPLRIREIKDTIRYVQVVDGSIRNEYTDDEMIFGVRNPRTDMKVYGYGLSELELLFRIVTALLWGVEWNIKQFSQGATIKGVFNAKGNIPQAQFEHFKRQWVLQTAGVANAFKTPILNADGIEWIPLQLSNQEMGYQQWLEFLIKIVCSIFLMDPAELNFDLRGSGGMAPAFMTTNEAQQKVSKDRGLQPLLRHIEDKLNRHIIWTENDSFEFAFVGLDAKTEEQAIELRLKQIQYKTVNEVRAEDDLPPVKEGDVILNPVYTGYIQQKAMMQAQQQGTPGGQPGGDPNQPQPQEAYDSKFNNKPFEKEEQHAGNQLEQEAASRDQSNAGPPDVHEDSDYGREDWEDSVHAALGDFDLKKSKQPTDDYVLSDDWF